MMKSIAKECVDSFEKPSLFRLFPLIYIFFLMDLASELARNGGGDYVPAFALLSFIFFWFTTALIERGRYFVFPLFLMMSVIFQILMMES